MATTKKTLKALHDASSGTVWLSLGHPYTSRAFETTRAAFTDRCEARLQDGILTLTSLPGEEATRVIGEFLNQLLHATLDECR